MYFTGLLSVLVPST